MALRWVAGGRKCGDLIRYSKPRSAYNLHAVRSVRLTTFRTRPSIRLGCCRYLSLVLPLSATGGLHVPWLNPLCDQSIRRRYNAEISHLCIRRRSIDMASLHNATAGDPKVRRTVYFTINLRGSAMDHSQQTCVETVTTMNN